MMMALALNLFWLPLATAGELTMGAGLGYLSSPYKGHDNMGVPLPIIHYEGEKFFIRGIGAGYKVWDSSPHAFSVGVIYHFNHFNPDDTSHQALRLLDKRRAEVRADARYSYKTDYGTLIASAAQDISGRSQGTTGDLTFRHTYDFGSFRLIPAVGLTWESARTVDYYYGISAKESQKSGLKEYEPDSSWSPHLGLVSTFYLSDTWSVTAGGRISFLSNEITDSPMVDSSKIVGATLGLNFAF